MVRENVRVLKREEHVSSFLIFRKCVELFLIETFSFQVLRLVYTKPQAATVRVSIVPRANDCFRNLKTEEYVSV